MNSKDEKMYAPERAEMVERQLIARGISDERVLSAMKKVPRHLFVPEDLRSCAYEDRALPIGEEQTISQPYMVAIMTELLELKGGEKVLEIGTGSGYQAAILSELAGEVFTIERVAGLASRAENILADLNYKNINIVIGGRNERPSGQSPLRRDSRHCRLPRDPPSPHRSALPERKDCHPCRRQVSANADRRDKNAGRDRNFKEHRVRVRSPDRRTRMAGV